MTGRIPPELGNLGNLLVLSLGRNQLSGGIPPELGNLGNLVSMWLEFNQLSGSIPPELENLANLVRLYLAPNNLTGCIPARLRNVANHDLDNLGLQDCDVTGVDDRAVLVALYNATDGPNWVRKDNWLSDRPIGEWFGVKTNAEGRVTGISLFTDVSTGNGLSGTIPSELGNLADLRRLDLRHNQLSGSIPPELGNLSNLGILWLFSNQLSGFIPRELGNLSNLYYLSLSNNRLSGSIPSELGNLSEMEELLLHGNQLSGSIPPSLGNLTKMNRLQLHNNGNLSGPMPDSFTNLENLEDLWLHNTGVCAPTDAAFQAWLAGIQGKSGVENCVTASPDRAALVALYNATNGPNWTTRINWLSDRPIGEWYGVTTDLSDRVTGLVLQSNQLSGSIPSELRDLSNLQRLWLNGNSLSGNIPSSLGSLSNLRQLSLHSNSLSGSIPPSLGNLSNLTGLWLNGNSLSGSIPSSLGDLNRLEDLELNFNQLTGSIPTSLGNLGSLLDMKLYSNQLTGSIPLSLGNLSNLQLLELGYNQLSGNIPSSLGNLGNLQNLYLRSNQLSGRIPSSLGNLDKLKTLDLSINSELTGPLPDSFTGLEDLNRLSMDDTGLCAPTDATFQTWLRGIQYRIGVVNCTSQDGTALEQFLDENPDIATAMIWQETENTFKPYPEWPSALKQKLGQAYGRALRDEGSGLPDVMINRAAGTISDDSFAWTILTQEDAEDLYVASVANSLALETQGDLAWSLDDLTERDLKLLLSSRYFFDFGYYPDRPNNVPGLAVRGYVLPAPPEVVHEFMDREGILGSTRSETIIRTIDWVRYNLQHFSGRWNAENMEAHWDYRGMAPLARMLEVGKATSGWDGLPRAYTAGCHGTNWFLVHFLRVVNIPVEYVTRAGHAIPLSLPRSCT